MLPVTIDATDSVGAQNSYHGPFKSSGGNFFTILIQNAAVNAYVATDPTSSFAEQDAANAPAFGSSVIQSVWLYQKADIIYVAGQNADDDVWHSQFDMAGNSGSGLWVEIATGDEDILVHNQAAETQANACSIAVEETGSDIVITYQGNPSQNKDMGGSFDWTAYAKSTDGGETWSNGNVVASTAEASEVDFFFSVIVLGSSDRFHIFFKDETNGDGYQRRLTTGSPDTLETFPSAFDSSIQGFYDGVSFVSDSDTKVRIPYRDTDSTISVAGFDSEDAPTVPFDTLVTGVSDTTARASDGSLSVDGDVQNLLYTDNTSRDIFHDQTGADDDTWGTDVKVLDAVTVDHISSNIYDRSGTKLAYIYDDGGAIKYNEVDIGGPSDTTVTVPLETLSQADNDPALFTGVTVVTPAETLAQTDNDPDVGTGIIVSAPAEALTQTDNAPTVPQIVGVPADSLSQTDNAPDLNTGVTVLTPAETLSQTDNDPVINTGASAAVPTETLAQTDNAPTVPQIVGPPADSLSQTDNIPDIFTGVTVVVPAETLSQTDNTPTVLTSIGVPVDSLSQTDNIPELNTGVTVLTPTETLSETDNIPGVGTGIIIPIPAETLSQTDNDPVVVSGGGALAPTDTLSQTDNDPALNTGVTVLTPAETLAQTDNAPTVPQIVAVPVDSLSQTDNAPSLFTGVTVSTPADALTETDNNPTIGSGTQIDPPADSLSQTDNIPALFTGVNVVTPLDTLAQNDNEPAANTGVTVGVPADTLSQTDNAPSVITGLRIGVPADALSQVDNTPSVSTGVKVFGILDTLAIVDNVPVISSTPATTGAPRHEGLRRNVGKMLR